MSLSFVAVPTVAVLATTSSTPGLLAAFGAGLVSFLSPCVLPLVPGYLSLMSGLSVGEVEQATASDRRRLLATTGLFVLGFSLVFISFGAVASSLGSLLIQHKRGLNQASGVLVVLMGLVVAGVLRPGALLRERRVHVSPARLGPYAAPVMGMAFAFGWTPCIGPVLAAVLALAAGRDTLSQGVALLVAYSVGLGVPFMVTGIAFGRLRTTWSWLKRHGTVIDRVAGAMLVGFGVLLLTEQLTRVSSFITSLWTSIGLDRLTVG